MTEYNTETINTSREKIAIKRSKKTLLWIIAAFFGPLFIAIFLYSKLDLWEPSGRSNQGELLLPTETLGLLNLETTDNQTINLDTIKGRWTMVYIAAGHCDTACEASLFKSRQVRSMMGRHIDRLQYVFLALDPTSFKSASNLKKNHPKMIIGLSPDSLSTKQERAFGNDARGYIYLLDPHGNKVLRYGDEATTKGIHKDLRKLFKISRIG